jgi:Family of unknown function (DUF6167)
MFRRTFWFTAGAAAGVWATTKVNRKLKQLAPDSLAAQAANKAVETGYRLKDFALDVRDNMARREAELGEALGLNAPVDNLGELPEPPRLPGPAGRHLAAVDNRTETRTHNRTDPGPADRPSAPYDHHNRNEDH